MRVLGGAWKRILTLRVGLCRHVAKECDACWAPLVPVELGLGFRSKTLN